MTNVFYNDGYNFAHLIHIGMKVVNISFAGDTTHYEVLHSYLSTENNNE